MTMKKLREFQTEASALGKQAIMDMPFTQDAINEVSSMEDHTITTWTRYRYRNPHLVSDLEMLYKAQDKGDIPTCLNFKQFSVLEDKKTEEGLRIEYWRIRLALHLAKSEAQSKGMSADVINQISHLSYDLRQSYFGASILGARLQEIANAPGGWGKIERACKAVQRNRLGWIDTCDMRLSWAVNDSEQIAKFVNKEVNKWVTTRK